MSAPERELLKIRASQAAEAIAGSGLNDEIVALQILENRGVVPEGTVQRAIDAVEADLPEKAAGSIFAKQGSRRSAF